MKKALYIILALFVLTAITVGINNISKNSTCPTTKESFTVRGNSMAGILESGDEVIAQMGYYACHEAKRGDLILYNLPSSQEPIVKIIKAIPGDTFEIRQADDGFNILVNGKVLTTTADQPYQISEKGATLLDLYVQDHDGVVPKNAYLILGNQPGGSMDSSRFGLVSIQDFLGRVTDY